MFSLIYFSLPITKYIVRSVMLILKTSLNGHVEYHTEYLDAIGIPEGGAVEIPSLLGRDRHNQSVQHFL